MKPAPDATAPVAVVYLARAAEGLGPVMAFADSYRAMPAGADHELIVVVKGEATPDVKSGLEAAFARIACRFVGMADTGFDLDAYAEAARRLPHAHVCFLNTFSIVLAAQWLRYLYTEALRPGVGLVGATGSFESNHDSLRFMQQVVWRHARIVQAGGTVPRAFERHFDWILEHLVPQLRGADDGGTPLAGEFASWWSQRCAAEPVFEALLAFPPFPNAHVRTNAFVMERERFLRFVGRPAVTRLDTSRLESGPASLTRLVRQSGLGVRVVGRDGRAYAPADWPRSRTFRLGAQDNLLVSDNRTRDYERSSQGWQTTHAWLAWGEPAIQLPPDFPRCDACLRTPGASGV